MSFIEDKIVEDVTYIYEMLRIEVKIPTIKISAKKLMRASVVSNFLYQNSRRYGSNTIQESQKNLFLILLGILIEVFRGVSVPKKFAAHINSLTKILIGGELESLKL